MKESQLKSIWEKYINVPIYRAIPQRHLRDIIQNGILPGEDPYREIHGEIRELGEKMTGIQRKKRNS